GDIEGRILSGALAPGARIATEHELAAAYDCSRMTVAKVLTQQMGVNVEPINVEGGGGATAIFQLFSTKPDGYTISLINIPGLLTRKIPGNFNLDKLTWLANVGRNSEGLVVGAKSPINSVADMQQLAATRPISFAMGGLGSSSYVATKVFAGATDISVKVVTGYKSSINSLLAVARGDVDAAIHPLSTIASMKDTSLIKLIVTFENKSSVPGVPSAIDIGQPDLVNVIQWQPVVAPPG
ncbi:MAG TPA: tripartite tricarboxylate transporter substrate-binding protein, partial [Acidocella sp.]|nr:tripartite tricarboxylate transporter substrate-binding protein [Acidocella sp.]